MTAKKERALSPSPSDLEGLLRCARALLAGHLRGMPLIFQCDREGHNFLRSTGSLEFAM